MKKKVSLRRLVKSIELDTAKMPEKVRTYVLEHLSADLWDVMTPSLRGVLVQNFESTASEMMFRAGYLGMPDATIANRAISEGNAQHRSRKEGGKSTAAKGEKSKARKYKRIMQAENELRATGERVSNKRIAKKTDLEERYVQRARLAMKKRSSPN